jgi:pimeloyl-ACP methyl ester carboxylesterase
VVRRLTRWKGRALRVAGALFAILFLFVVQRALLVSVLALKIIGEPAALDAWKGPVVHRTVTYAAIPIDIYGNDKSRSAVLIVHGVNPTGKNSLDLVRISEALAQAGFEVFAPDLADMRKLHLTPEEIGNIKNVFQFIGRDAGIACFSYGCGPAIAAAADADIRNRIRFVLAFGGYFDIREALEFLVTGPEPPVAWAKSDYLASNPDLGETAAERQQVVGLFASTTPEEFRTRFHNLPGTVQARLQAISPANYLSQLRAPLILVHGLEDPVIPSQQSLEFAQAARTRGLDCSLTLLRMYGHVNQVWPAVGVSSLARFYIPEVFRLLRVVNRLTSYS